MRIEDVQTYLLRVPLRRPLITSYGERGFAEFVVVQLVTDEGITGVGEASPIPTYDEGDVSGSIYVLRQYFLPVLLGQDPRHIGFLIRLLDDILPGYYYIKSAIDMALHDLLGKIVNQPLFRLLGGRTTRIPVIWLVSSNDGEKAIEEAAQKVQEGYRSIKVKIGLHWDQDFSFLKELRKAVGAETEIRVDVNGAWNWKEALRRIREMESIGIAHVEQPVPSWDLKGLKRVTFLSPIPVVADECVRTLKELYVVASLRAADRVNIKLSRCGGFRHALQMTALAEAAGLSVVIGSMLEYGIGTAASLHFAAALDYDVISVEAIGPLLALDDVVTPPIIYKQGYAYLNERPGLGVELDKMKLALYMQEVKK